MRDTAERVRGISPTIGVALLLVIVVALATLAAVSFSEQSNQQLGEPAPVAGIEFDFEQRQATVVATHRSGTVLNTSNLEVRGPGKATSPSQTLRSGQSFTIEPTKPGGEFLLVHRRSDNSDSIIARTKNPLTHDLGGVPEQITLGYEDLTVDRSDYDYNDWAFDLQTRITGYWEDDTRHATELRFQFDPLARGGGYSHKQFILPDELGSGEYNLTVRDSSGNVIRQESGSFDSQSKIFVLDSGNIFDSQTNAKPSSQCVEPARNASLTFDLDGPTPIPDNPIDENKQHGAGLPFNPVMEPSGNDEQIEIGDPRMVTVPTNWKWPVERAHIANAYDDVGPEDPDNKGDPPEFKNKKWFEQVEDPSLVYGNCR